MWCHAKPRDIHLKGFEAKRIRAKKDSKPKGFETQKDSKPKGFETKRIRNRGPMTTIEYFGNHVTWRHRKYWGSLFLSHAHNSTRKSLSKSTESVHASQRCWNRAGMCGVQQSASRLEYLDQRPCVSQRSNFIEIPPIAANYGRTFCARMIGTIPMEDLR